VATEHEHQIYVERVGDGYRWSLTHPGGGYPLLRITARFLRVEYARVMVPFRTVTAGVCVVCRDPQEASSAKRWAVIQFDVATPAGFVRERITETFGQPEERREGRDGIQEPRALSRCVGSGPCGRAATVLTFRWSGRVR
jgi:hypothetical protein